ncbi:MAG: Poly-beta-hydroxybutyrate polymerase [Deltaproteobacteria bacterium ADurb.Bin207]|jgi:polyhydroxyalkanoate synthase|nr:MAG: Poly-beta-hydroxybutyrate polymerase [Deltaproteobacteria bacterium ADurb.Bin207]
MMGSAPADLVFARGKLRLYRLRPRDAEEYELGTATHRIESPRYRTPVLVVPPLMVRPYIYDLRPEHSMLRTLRDAGLDVFVVDFGVPDRGDRDVRLDDYVLDFMPSFVDAALQASGASGIAMVGYCMGGLFSLLHVGTFDDSRVRALVTIGSPVNFKKMGVVTIAATLGAPAVDRALDVLGNVPGSLSSVAFKLINGPRTFTRYVDLLRNLHDEDYVRGFLVINHWVNDMIPYPREAFRQMFREIVYENRLLENRLSFGGRTCDFRRIRCPLFAVAGKTDMIATPASTRGIVDLLSSTDKTFREVPGGHVAVVAGSEAPEHVWKPIADWLLDRLVARTMPPAACCQRMKQ